MTESKASDGRSKVILNDQVTCFALCHYGSGYSAMQSSLSIILLKSTDGIKIKTLSTPVEFQLAVYNDKAASLASKKVSILLTNMLSGHELLVRLSYVESSVMIQNMPKALLGRTFIYILGFIFGAHLTRVKTN